MLCLCDRIGNTSVTKNFLARVFSPRGGKKLLLIKETWLSCHVCILGMVYLSSRLSPVYVLQNLEYAQRSAKSILVFSPFLCCGIHLYHSAAGPLKLGHDQLCAWPIKTCKVLVILLFNDDSDDAASGDTALALIQTPSTNWFVGICSTDGTSWSSLGALQTELFCLIVCKHLHSILLNVYRASS